MELLATGNNHCSIDILHGDQCISEEELANTEPLDNTLDKR